MDSISGRVKNNLSPKEVQTNDTALDKLYDRNYFTLNHKIASKKSMLLIALIIPLAVFFLGNFAFNCMGEALSSIAQRTAFHFSMSWFFVPPMSGGYFIVVIGLTVILEICVPYRLWSSYRDFNMHIKGSERWATMDELRKQYKAVPETDGSFEGYGGIPIAWDREKHEILIDDSSVNNYIIGTTRSGKGESLIFPTIDIYSRAEKKATMVISDPKLELYKASYSTLLERGYECHVLNLSNPVESMRYNPLQTILDAWKNGEVATAEELCQTFCYSIFNGDGGSKGSGDDEFWNSTGTNLLSAMILAHISDCIELDKQATAKWKSNYDNRRKAFESLDDEEKAMVRGQHEDMTYLEVMNEGSVPIEDDPKFAFQPCTDHEKQVTMYSIYVSFSAMASAKVEDDKTCLDVYFEKRPMNDRARLKYTAANVAGDKTKASIYATMISKLTIFSYENIAKMTSASDIDLLDVGFGKKPLAIFMSLPDYDSSNSFIATVFLRQLYFVLAKHVSINTDSGKCDRKVVFLLDEFGNIPPIPQLASIITVCLGRNIHYDLVVQSNQQLKEKYGESYQTIRGNCGNWIFLSSGDKETRQEFSDELGNETVLSLTRSGESLKLTKSFSESYEQKPLMDAAQLAGLHEGENVVKRDMKRTDLENKDVRRSPILNTGNRRFKYRYEYLTKTFPNLDSIPAEKLPVFPDNSGILLKDHTYDIDAHFDRLRDEETGKRNVPTKAHVPTEMAHPRNPSDAEEFVREHPSRRPRNFRVKTSGGEWRSQNSDS